MKQKCEISISKMFCVAAMVILFLTVGASVCSEATFAYLVGVASWYSEESPGILPTTANMEVFNHDKMTCAIWGLPFDTMLEVTNIENGKSVIVRVNDRGPAKRLCDQGRVIDLTKAAFKKINKLNAGLVKVKVRILKYGAAKLLFLQFFRR